MKLLFVFLLFSSSIKAQFDSDTSQIAYKITKYSTRAIDTTIQYKIYDSHGASVDTTAKVQIFFAGKRLLAARRIFEENAKFDNYYFYFEKDRLKMIQYWKTNSEELFICEPPICKIPGGDKLLTNAIIASFREWNN